MQIVLQNIYGTGKLKLNLLVGDRFMKGLETGKDKVKKICDELRKQTLEPAQAEAARVIEGARAEALQIVEDAKRLAENMHAAARMEIQKEKEMFHASLKHACAQAVETLKGWIEDKFFFSGLRSLISGDMRKPDVIARLITAVVDAIDKEGMDAKVSAYIPAVVSPREVNALLVNHILDRLQEKSVLLADIGGGVRIELHKENMMIDISDGALQEIVSGYVRKDFRDLVFGG